MVPSDPSTIMTAMIEAQRITKHTGQSMIRAEANGPVGPAMAGPIIEPANLFFIFLMFLLYFLAGMIIEPGFFRYYF